MNICFRPLSLAELFSLSCFWVLWGDYLLETTFCCSNCGIWFNIQSRVKLSQTRVSFRKSKKMTKVVFNIIKKYPNKCCVSLSFRTFSISKEGNHYKAHECRQKTSSGRFSELTFSEPRQNMIPKRPQPRPPLPVLAGFWVSLLPYFTMFYNVYTIIKLQAAENSLLSM